MIVIILRGDDAQLLSLRLKTQHIPQHMANPGITYTDVHPLTSCIPNGVTRSRNNRGNNSVYANHKKVYLKCCFVYFSYLPCQDLVYTACSYPSISQCLWETFVVVFMQEYNIWAIAFQALVNQIVCLSYSISATSSGECLNHFSADSRSNILDKS